MNIGFCIYSVSRRWVYVTPPGFLFCSIKYDFNTMYLKHYDINTNEYIND